MLSHYSKLTGYQYFSSLTGLTHSVSRYLTLCLSLSAVYQISQSAGFKNKRVTYIFYREFPHFYFFFFTYHEYGFILYGKENRFCFWFCFFGGGGVQGTSFMYFLRVWKGTCRAVWSCNLQTTVKRNTYLTSIAAETFTRPVLTSKFISIPVTSANYKTDATPQDFKIYNMFACLSFFNTSKTLE